MFGGLSRFFVVMRHLCALFIAGTINQQFLGLALVFLFLSFNSTYFLCHTLT
ncbi:hypothetical protein D927_01422 [Enterococcus faecalis 02-MB-BW-10]|nr:hypothetical protein D927_01422 [Enterococcus faecalis 02-MB-BW-10]